MSRGLPLFLLEKNPVGKSGESISEDRGMGHGEDKPSENGKRERDYKVDVLLKIEDAFVQNINYIPQNSKITPTSLPSHLFQKKKKNPPILQTPSPLLTSQISLTSPHHNLPPTIRLPSKQSHHSLKHIPNGR